MIRSQKTEPPGKSGAVQPNDAETVFGAFGLSLAQVLEGESYPRRRGNNRIEKRFQPSRGQHRERG